jgi:hypothetical protein
MGDLALIVGGLALAYTIIRGFNLIKKLIGA